MTELIQSPYVNPNGRTQEDAMHRAQYLLRSEIKKLEAMGLSPSSPLIKKLEGFVGNDPASIYAAINAVREKEGMAREFLAHKADEPAVLHSDHELYRLLAKQAGAGFRENLAHCGGKPQGTLANIEAVSSGLNVGKDTKGHTPDIV